MEVDRLRLLDLLLKELAPYSLEDIVGLAITPKFEESTRVMDWRNHVLNPGEHRDKKVVASWLKQPLEERVAEVAFALHRAANEEWE